MNVFFGDTDLGAAWDTVGTAGADDQLDALRLLAANRDQLPGAVFFAPPVDWADNPAWVELADAAEREAPYDPFGSSGPRSLLVPSRGRSRFVADGPPRRVVVTSDSPLFIAPWGGDFSSAYMRFEVRGNKLVGRGSPNKTQPSYEHEVDIVLTLSGPRPNEQELNLFDAQDLLKRVGENICMQQVAGLNLPVCSMTKVELVDRRWEVSFELDASVAQVQPTE